MSVRTKKLFSHFRHTDLQSKLFALGYALRSQQSRIRYIFTPLDEAVSEIERRRKDPILQKRIAEYITGSIPDYYDQETPIFSLSRYLATPNFELLYALERIEKYNFPLIVTEDHSSKFISHSALKRALAKLPVVKGYSRNNDEIIEYFTVVDFKQYHGKKISEIDTKCNESLISFHQQLMQHMGLKNVQVANETEWVDEHERNNVRKHYAQMLALFCTHGILLEAYPPEEHSFVLKVVYPAVKEVERALGIKPLIVEHITDEEETERDWNAYPTKLYKFIQGKCQNI